MVKCIRPWTNLFINDNEIRFCCWSPVVIGQLNKDTVLSDFWNGKEARQMRRHLLSGDFIGCCPESCPSFNDEGGSFQKFARNKKHFGKNELLIYEEIKNSSAIVKSKPYEMTLAMDHSCPLRCIMCVDRQKRSGYVISKGIYKLTGEILDDLNLIFFTGGEPFYSERAAEFIEHFKERKEALKWGFITCGLNINMKLIKSLKIDRICVSIDAITKKLYESIRIGSHFQTVVKNLKALLRFRKNNYFFPIRIMFVIMSYNYAQIPQAVRFFESLDLEMEFRMFLPYEGCPGEIDLAKEKRYWRDFWKVLGRAEVMAKRSATLNSLNIAKNTARLFIARDLYVKK